MQVRLTLYPTSNLFMPGHRIRLDVSRSRFDVNRNTGERSAGAAAVVADNIVLHERGRESRLVVALIAVGRGVRRL